jgi:PAS domain S-box-containing protein
MLGEPIRRSSYLLLGAFIALTLVIFFVGYHHYVEQKSTIETQVRNQLEAVVELKVSQLVAWRKEKLGDAKRITAGAQMTPVWQVLAASDPKARERVLAWMEAMLEASDYANAILLDSRGRICLSLGRVAGPSPVYAALAKRVQERGEVVFSDFHYDEGLKGPHLGLNIPLRSAPKGPVEGVLLLGIDPNKYLYPLIESWPAPSRTAETILVRKEGNEVLYLNNVRHRKDTALKLRFQLANGLGPAVRGALGFEGVADGIDYRGIPVLAAVRKVPDSPWILIAKMDASEVYAPIHEQARWLALVVCSLILAVGTGAGLIWRHLRSRFYQQKYEAELDQKRSLALFNSVIDATTDAVYVKDREGRYLVANSATCKVTGLQLEEILGHDDTALFPAGIAKEVMDRDRAFMASGQMGTVEEPVVFKNGLSATYLTAKGPIFDDNGNVTGLYGIARNITDRLRSEEERAKLQEQLQQAQKMESVGRLAGGVAHDFNNLLTVINGYAALVLATLSEGDPLRESISEIAGAGERAAGLTQQLLAFSRKQIVEPKVLDLNEVIAEAIKMLRRLLGEDIEVVTTLAPSLGHVLMDAGQVHQVLMNLAVNARDALPEGGRFVIETANVEIDEDYVAVHANTKAGPAVLLTVTDNGAGMDEETRQRAFEPFFTTKGQGAGTGLGLSTVYGIVKHSGGWLWLYSEPGRGTTFKIYLPRVAEVAEPRKASRPDVAPLVGTETVLVVEDQAEVRKLTIDVLKRYGYQVLEACDGAEALLRSSGFADPIHLMITDVVMPGITGRELAAQLAALRPEMKVLYVSGYPAGAMAEDGALHDGTAYLSKPFAPSALARKARELLG